MQIGELARRFEVTVESVRYYEREGLLPKARRTSGNYRVYDEAYARQLSFVLNCRSLGLSQCEIRELLAVRAAPTRDCGNVNALIDGHIEQVSQRIRDLKALLAELKCLRLSCGEARAAHDCKILGSLAGASRKPPSRPRTRQ